MMDALRRAKLSLHRIQFSVWAYETSLFCVIMDASLLKNVVAARPIPPVVDSTSGVKVACSISRSSILYARIMYTGCIRGY